MSSSTSDFLQDLLWTSGPSHDDNEGLIKPTSEGTSVIHEGLIFSRKFILSYNVVLLIILFGYSVWYWAHRVSQARRQVKGNRYPEESFSPYTASLDTDTCETQPSSDSASSSTANSSLETPPGRAKERGQVDETTSLLRRTSTPPKSHSPLRILRSWLIYQPGNIPIVNKTLPSNATSVATLLFLGLNLFYLLYRVPFAPAYSFVPADRAGLLFVANLPLLYLFAAKNQPIKWLTGHSYETLNIIHRRLGEWMCFLALIHLIGMVATWYILLSARVSFSRFLAIKLIWLGLASFLSYEMLYMTSLGSFRQRFYELFLALHVFLQASALGFLFFHHPTCRIYVGTALGIFVVDRIIFRIGLKTRTMKADLSILEDGETVLLSSDWEISSTSWWRTRPDIRHGWKPTEHVFLSVPALSKKHIVQAHPFTIASAAPLWSANTTTCPNHAWLNFIIRARDGFSRDLLVHAQSHRSTKVRVDGPYGSLHAREMLQESDHAIVIASGSGIAVAHPLIWDLLSSSGQANPRRRRVTLIWIVHDLAHLDWIGMDRLNDLRERGLHLVTPPPTRKAGRPDVDNLLVDACLGDSETAESSSIGVVISGPDSMNRSARNTCAELVRRGLNVRVSVEKFGW